MIKQPVILKFVYIGGFSFLLFLAGPPFTPITGKVPATVREHLDRYLTGVTTAIAPE